MGDSTSFACSLYRHTPIAQDVESGDISKGEGSEKTHSFGGGLWDFSTLRMDNHTLEPPTRIRTRFIEVPARSHGSTDCWGCSMSAPPPSCLTGSLTLGLSVRMSFNLKLLLSSPLSPNSCKSAGTGDSALGTSPELCSSSSEADMAQSNSGSSSPELRQVKRATKNSKNATHYSYFPLSFSITCNTIFTG